MCPGKGELLEERLHALPVEGAVRIDLAVGPLEPGRTEHARRAVARTRDEDHLEIVADDDAIEMRVEEGEAGRGTPVAEQAVLDVLRTQRFAQQRVLAQVDHPDAEVVAGAPPGVDAFEFHFGERCGDNVHGDPRRLGRRRRRRSGTGGGHALTRINRTARGSPPSDQTTLDARSEGLLATEPTRDGDRNVTVRGPGTGGG